MRIGHLQPTRPEWFDRRPTPLGVWASPTITGADVGTVQATYTVPSGKKAYLDVSSITMFRTAVGTAPARAIGRLLYNWGSGEFILQSVDSDVSTWGPVGDQWLGQGGILTAGQTLSWQTIITFTDGTVAYRCVAKVTEFDA